MRYYAIDFGNSNTSVARFEPEALSRAKAPFMPEVLTHEDIAFHYHPEGRRILIPTCIDPEGRIGQAAKGSAQVIAEIKRRLKQTPAPADDIRHCANFLCGLFSNLGIQLTKEDRMVITIPSVGREAGEAAYTATLKQALASALDDFPTLDKAGVFQFCGEALAAAVSYRAFQGRSGYDRAVLCLDIGSYSADATYFEIIDYRQVQTNEPLRLQSNGLALAGSDVNQWIREWASAKGREVTVDQCEDAKIRLSRGETLTATDSPLGDLLTGPVLNELLEKNGFFSDLAQLCASVLPPPVQTDPTLLRNVQFLFTGGSSQFPHLAETLLRTLWTQLFSGSTNLQLPDFRRYRPFDACVTGAAWWLWLRDPDHRFIPVLDRDYALRLFEPTGANDLREAPETFLTQGQDITGGLHLQYDLVPASPDQEHYCIDILAYDEGGNCETQGSIEGALEGDSLAIDLNLDSTGCLTVAAKGRRDELFLA